MCDVNMRMRVAVFLLIMFIAIIPMNGKFTIIINAASDSSSFFTESVNVCVNCTSAKLYISCRASSNDTSLVHFPPEIEMAEPN